MPRTPGYALALSLLAVSLSACAGNSQPGCTQQPDQQYAPMTLVYPTPGMTNVRDSIRRIQVSTQQSEIIGVLTLVPSSGQTLNAGASELAKTQPNPSAFLWNVAIPPVAAHTMYTLRQTITYAGACFGPSTTQTHDVATFTTQ